MTTDNDDRPAPLLDPRIDLPDHHDAMMIYTRHMLTSNLTVDSTGEEFKAFWLLAWQARLQRPAGSLPNDDARLARYAKVSPRLWKKLKPRVMREFVLCSDDRFYLEFVVDDVTRAHAKTEKRRGAANRRWDNERARQGSKGARASGSCGDPVHTDHDTIEAASADALHMQVRCNASALHMPTPSRRDGVLSSNSESVETELPVPELRAREAVARAALLGEWSGELQPRANGFRWVRREVAEGRLLKALIAEGTSPGDAVDLIARASDPAADGFDEAARRCTTVSWRHRAGWYRPARRQVQ